MMSNAELALASVLSLRGALPWDAAKRATALDDDALSDAVDALLARGALRLVRAAEPEPVALELTDMGAMSFASTASTSWRVDRRAPLRR
jgi:hypothetical protein